MSGFIEQSIADGFTQVTGDPLLAGLMFVGFFLAFVMLQGTRLEGKIVVILPVLFLSLTFIPILLVFAVIGAAGISYLAITRAVNR
jgi:hypothetical protein